jgi:hypothetical protein
VRACSGLGSQALHVARWVVSEGLSNGVPCEKDVRSALLQCWRVSALVSPVGDAMDDACMKQGVELLGSAPCGEDVRNVLQVALSRLPWMRTRPEVKETRSTLHAFEKDTEVCASIMRNIRDVMQTASSTSSQNRTDACKTVREVLMGCASCLQRGHVAALQVASAGVSALVLITNETHQANFLTPIYKALDLETLADPDENMASIASGGVDACARELSEAVEAAIIACQEALNSKMDGWKALWNRTQELAATSPRHTLLSIALQLEMTNMHSNAVKQALGRIMSVDCGTVDIFRSIFGRVRRLGGSLIDHVRRVWVHMFDLGIAPDMQCFEDLVRIAQRNFPSDANIQKDSAHATAMLVLDSFEELTADGTPGNMTADTAAILLRILRKGIFKPSSLSAVLKAVRRVLAAVPRDAKIKTLYAEALLSMGNADAFYFAPR